MEKVKQGVLNNEFHFVEIFECPLDVILFAAGFGAGHVTVENYRNFRNPQSVQIQILADKTAVQPHIKSLLADFAITRSQFLELAPIWDSQGVYAVFHDAGQIKFRASDIHESSRYKALSGFAWNLEIAVPDSASDGWSRFVSPDLSIIERITVHARAIL